VTVNIFGELALTVSRVNIRKKNKMIKKAMGLSSFTAKSQFKKKK